MREKTQFNFALRWQQSDPEAKRKQKFRQRLSWAIVGGLVVLFVVTAPLAWMLKLQLQQNSLRQEIAALNNINILMNKANQLTAEVNNQKKVLEMARSNSHDPQVIMEQLSKLVPQGAVISSFSLKSDVVSIQIQLSTPVDVARLWTSLNDSHMFEKVDIQTLSLADKPQTLSLNLKLIRQNPSQSQQTAKQNNPGDQNGANAPNGVSPANGGMAP